MGIKAWITVNGQHIPVMDGESKMGAVGRFIKSKRKDKRDKKFAEHFDKMDEKMHEANLRYPAPEDEKYYDEIAAYGSKYADEYMQKKYGKNWDAKQKIKGREKTKEEKLDRLFDEAADAEIEKDYLYSKGNLRDYQNAKIRYQMANKRYEKEKAKPISKYKLNNAKSGITVNSQVGDTFKDERGSKIKLTAFHGDGSVAVEKLRKDGSLYGKKVFEDIKDVRRYLRENGYSTRPTNRK